MELRDNEEQHRLEIEIDGQTVFCNYRRSGDTLQLTHVETPVGLRGQGAAGKLMQAIAAWAKAENIKLVPVCSYAVSWMQRHADVA